LNFLQPAAINANTTYVASYSTFGAYMATPNYFQNQGADNAPLHALQNGVDGPNGVFQSGTGPKFPDTGMNSSNFWVDLIFASSNSATITVTRNGGSLGAVGVHFATGGGTAVAGTDYTPVSVDVNFANGDTASKSINVPLMDYGLSGS